MSSATILKLAAAMSSGFYFHGCLYMSLIEHPSRACLPIEAFLEQWRKSCEQSKMCFVSSEILTLVWTFLLYVIDPVEEASFWLICPVCLIATIVWSILMILPAMKITIMDDVHHKKDQRWIRSTVDSIMRRHLVRVALASVVHLTVLRLSCFG